MDFKTFQKSIDLVKYWREKESKLPHEWPDPRDPSFSKYLEESGAVAQDLEKSLVALCCWREGRTEMYPGMSAVLHVLVNREKKGVHRSHLTDVETFSMGYPDNPHKEDYPEEEINFTRLLENLDVVLAGKTFDSTNGSQYFTEKGYYIPPNFVKLSVVGSLIFYRNYDKSLDTGKV
jgi:hypothetical protein